MSVQSAATNPSRTHAKPRYSPTTSARFRTKAFRLLTSPWRVLPDFIIIGAQRAGTTSLFEYLVQHPGIIPGLYKEVRYFTDRWKLGPLYYRACFPTRGEMQRARESSPTCTFEATPEYMWSAVALQRIKNRMPNVRLVAILRDPIERALSQYGRSVKRGLETLPFEVAIDAEPERLAREPGEPDEQYFSRTDVRHFSYLMRSEYAPQLRRVLELFDPSQLHVMCFETLIDDPHTHFGNL